MEQEPQDLEEDPERRLIEALLKRLRLSLPVVDVPDDETEPPTDDREDDLRWLSDFSVHLERQ